jgi:hypothetical protein
MKIPTTISELTALFRKFGARHPESWAKSQINEGIPQLQRFLFLRQAWKQVRQDEECGWVRTEIKNWQKQADAPFSDVGRVFSLCLEKGISAEDLASLARALQAQMLANVCYTLEEPAFEEVELADFAWGLFQIDEDGNALGDGIRMLHESVLETDPTGREVRPRKIVFPKAANP